METATASRLLEPLPFMGRETDLEEPAPTLVGQGRAALGYTPAPHSMPSSPTVQGESSAGWVRCVC